jgi:hypothetical protein
MRMQELVAAINEDFFLDAKPEIILEMIENGLIEASAIENKWLGKFVISGSNVSLQ